MTRRTLAIGMSSLSLAFGAGTSMAYATPGDGKVPEITTATERHGWPHRPSGKELVRLADYVAMDLASYIGTEPNVTRCRSFKQCRAAWSEGGRVTVRLRVYEDGSYRVLAVLFPVTRNV